MEHVFDDRDWGDDDFTEGAWIGTGPAIASLERRNFPTNAADARVFVERATRF